MRQGGQKMSGVRFSKWDPEAVKRAALAEVAENAAIVGQFVEAEARRNLEAIDRPDSKRSVAWRRFLARYVLRHTVEVDAETIVIRVGILTNSKPGGNTRGLRVELGSYDTPAHPYLRPAVFGNAKKIVALLSGR